MGSKLYYEASSPLGVDEDLLGLEKADVGATDVFLPPLYPPHHFP